MTQLNAPREIVDGAAFRARHLRRQGLSEADFGFHLGHRPALHGEPLEVDDEGVRRGRWGVTRVQPTNGLGILVLRTRNRL